MIRPLTLITMLLAAGSGAYLFGVKHHAQMLDDQIAEISQASRLDGQRIRVLQAQWALETDPNRLQQLAAQFTHLQPMQPVQLVTLASLRASLPPAGSAAPGGNPELPDAAPPEIASLGSPDGGDAGAGALPLPPPLAPMMMAAAGMAPKSLAHAPRRASHSALASTRFAEALPPPRPYGASPRSYDAPHGYAATPMPPVGRTASMGGPMGAQVVSVKAMASVPQYVPAAQSAPDSSGSALGMAANMAPPQAMPQSGLNN